MGLIHGGGALAAGLALGTTYILSVGPNNMMIIREGLVRGRIVLVATLVFLSYVALLLVSYRMTDAIAGWDTSLTVVLSCLGLAAMVWFAVLSIRAAIGRESRGFELAGGEEPLGRCLRRVAIVVAVNPLLYIEFLLIPAGALGTFKEAPLRLEFTIGLILMSALTCYGYAAGGRVCAGLFRRHRAMQAFDLACACLLSVLAVTLGLELMRAVQR